MNILSINMNIIMNKPLSIFTLIFYNILSTQSQFDYLQISKLVKW